VEWALAKSDEGAKEGIEEFLQIKNVAISLQAAMRCRGNGRHGTDRECGSDSLGPPQ
jgi:hypothetical protein